MPLAVSGFFLVLCFKKNEKITSLDIVFRIYVNNKEIFESHPYELLPSQPNNFAMNLVDGGVELSGDVRIDFCVRRKIEFLQQGLPRHKKVRENNTIFIDFLK